MTMTLRHSEYYIYKTISETHCQSSSSLSTKSALFGPSPEVVGKERELSADRSSSRVSWSGSN